MALTEKALKSLKPKEKPVLIRDDRGLYIRVEPNGKKYWRIRLWINSKEIRRSLGVYPDVSLKEARQKRDEIKLRVANGEDPFIEGVPLDDTFKKVFEEWYQTKVLPIKAESTARRAKYRVNRFVLPAIGHMPIKAINSSHILNLIRPIESKGSYETAHRVLMLCSQIFRYATAINKAERDITTDLRGALVPVKVKHHASITDPQEIGALMRAIDSLSMTPIVQAALKFQAYTFVRPGELRHAEWSEIDLRKAEWRIPAEKMKMKRVHIVPLSRQAVEVLRAIHPITGYSRYVFHTVRNTERPMSENTVNAALRRMGYSKDQMTGHGFRSMASTQLNEHGWSSDAIERQLAHVEENSVRAAYNYAELLDTRRDMMQWWGDWLEKTKE